MIVLEDNLYLMRLLKHADCFVRVTNSVQAQVRIKFKENRANVVKVMKTGASLLYPNPGLDDVVTKFEIHVEQRKYGDWCSKMYVFGGMKTTKIYCTLFNRITFPSF